MAIVQHHTIITCKPRDVNMISTIKFKSATSLSPQCYYMPDCFPPGGVWEQDTTPHLPCTLSRRPSPVNTTPYCTRELCIWHAGNVAAQSENNYQCTEKAPLHAIDS